MIDAAAIPGSHDPGKGYVGPPGLNRATSKLTRRVVIICFLLLLILNDA